FGRLIKNTVFLSLYSLIFSFPFPILFALLLNELRAPRLKKVYQTISYLPHFVSVVVLVGLMQSLLSPAGGPIDKLTHALGGQRVDYMRASRWFRTLYVGSGIWQSFGWNSIVYLAALTGISPELYEAATVDGANRYRQALHVTLPGIMPTMVILLILNMGNILNVGSDKILLMYSPNTYDVADVISTYVYRKSLLGGEFSFGVAMGLFNNVFNLLFVAVANAISRRVTEVSLW
ncbi:MAG: sugar ABC transporter permease, partial [Clostridiales bacterium]|nr:sugar ABC transporter permease [Clostridiales bacterium]